MNDKDILVIHPYLKRKRINKDYYLEEAVNLVKAINLNCVDSILVGLDKISSKTYFNEGFSSQTGKIYSGGGIGTFLGFHFWDRLRVETTYLNSALEANSNDEFRYFGQYFSYGLGLRLWKGFMLNYSKFNNQYTQSENDETGLTLGLSNNIKTEGESISLSYILVIK